MNKKDKEQIRQSCHDAMIRHLDGTPNHELRELISDYLADVERVSNGDYDDMMTQEQQDEYIEGLETVCNGLEQLIGQTEQEQCDSKGPNGLVCSRHGTEHSWHGTYQSDNGKLYSVKWFECNPIGEPVDDD